MIQISKHIIAPRNIILLSVMFFLAGFMTINSPFPLGNLWIVSVFFIVLLALPAFYGLILFLGMRRGIFTIILLSIFAIVFETFAIKTGFPYGNFNYTDLIGPKLFNIVPFSIAFAWTPLVIGCLALSSKLGVKRIHQIILSGFLLMLVDMVLDPGAVALNFWVWELQDFFYKVPLSNFIGWFISGVIGSTLLLLCIRGKKLNQISLHISKLMIVSTYFICIYWTSITLFSGLFIASLIGLCLMIPMFKILASPR